MGIRQLDKNSDRPLYRQLAGLLVTKIESGVFLAGSRLPSERELCEEYNVSRITARQAITTLLEDGLIFREQGRGTFVAEPRMRRLQGLTSFTEDMLARGFQPKSQVLVHEVLEGEPTLSRALSQALSAVEGPALSAVEGAVEWEEMHRSLRLQPGDRVLHLVRLRLANDKPVAIQASHISLGLCPGLEDEDFTNQSLFALLREKYHVNPSWTEIDVQAVPASKEEASLLQVSANAPLLVLRGKTFTDSFEPIETVRTTYIGKGLALYIGRHRINPERSRRTGGTR